MATVMRGPIVRTFAILIICTIIAVLFFNAGIQFADRSERKSRDYIFGGTGNGREAAAIVGAALPAMSLDFDDRHPRRRRVPGSGGDSTAFSVDGVHFPDSSTKLLFSTREKFKNKQMMSGGMFYTPVHDGTLLLHGGNASAAKAEKPMTFLKSMTKTHEVSTTLLFSFSPDVERRVKSMFPDPMNENIFYANSPALYWDRDFNDGIGRLIVVMRIWLDRERYEEKNNWPKNAFLDNYFYTRTYDNEFKPLDPGSIMVIF